MYRFTGKGTLSARMYLVDIEANVHLFCPDCSLALLDSSPVKLHILCFSRAIRSRVHLAGLGLIPAERIYPFAKAPPLSA